MFMTKGGEGEKNPNQGSECFLPCCHGKGATFKGWLVKVCSILCRCCPYFTPQPNPLCLVLLSVLYFSRTQTDVICTNLASSSTETR